jgi:L-seryl-tRNA(Ser) seleniumtransferase
MLWFLNTGNPLGKIKDEEFVAIGKKYNIPTFNDCAADVPPVENLWKHTQMGFDLVCFSGGKGIRGPQSAGLPPWQKGSDSRCPQERTTQWRHRWKGNES